MNKVQRENVTIKAHKNKGRTEIRNSIKHIYLSKPRLQFDVIMTEFVRTLIVK